MLIIWGAVGLFGWLYHLVAAAISGVHISWDTATKHFTLTDLPVWLTAIATGSLVWATLALNAATSRQVKADGPLVAVNILTSRPSAPIIVGPYVPEFGEADLRQGTLAPYLGQQNFLYLQVSNQQKKPTGVAGEIEIKVTLFYGQTEAPNHPYRFDRTAVIPIIAPDTFIVGPIFNVGTLPAYMVSVVSVTYRDIFGNRRSAAYGSNILIQNANAAPIRGYKIFEPMKGEF